MLLFPRKGIHFHGFHKAGVGMSCIVQMPVKPCHLEKQQKITAARAIQKVFGISVGRFHI